MARAGTVLWLDLTDRRVERESTGVYAPEYVGGRGIGAKLIYNRVPPEVSAYDARNLITFNAGPLSGTLLGNKVNVMTKSPQLIHNLLTSATMGGQFGSEMKFAGYDNVAIYGKADKPVYLYIDNDRVEIRDASHLWGLGTYETQVRIKEELSDPEVQILCIGPAGENMIAYSMIVHDIHNTASRGGAGAVMGSKNLKAVAVRGTKGLKIGDPEAFKALIRGEYEWRITGPGKPTQDLLHKWGWMRYCGDCYGVYESAPWDNYNTYISPPIPPEQMMESFWNKHFASRTGCTFCPTQCQQTYNVPGIGNFGTMCQNYAEYRWQVKNYDTKTWAKAMYWSNLYGIDSITMTNIISWLMDLYEKGVITAADTDGVPMEWGSDEAILTVIHKVAKKDGFGKILVDGIVPAAEKIGRDSIQYACHTLNMDYFPIFSGISSNIGCVTGTRADLMTSETTIETEGEVVIAEFEKTRPDLPKGEVRKMVDADRAYWAEQHTGDKDAWMILDKKGEFRYKDKAKLARGITPLFILCDLLGVCNFWSNRLAFTGVTTGFDEMAEWLSAGTGVACTPDKLRETAEKVHLLERSYDILCGRRREEEVLPDKFYRPIKSNIYGDVAVDGAKFEEVKTEYYTLIGSDPETGIPTREALVKFGLKDVADRLEKVLVSAEKAPADKARAKKAVK